MNEPLSETEPDRNENQDRPRRTLSVWLAIGFGAGDSPFAPGTVGSLWGPVLVWGLLMMQIESFWMLPVIVILFFVGVPLCDAGAKYYGKKDPGAVVFDEIAAYPLVHLLIPLNSVSILPGFLLFRLFDIWKPYPTKRFEQLPGGWGVMADDTIAALYAMLSLWLIMKFFG